MACCWSSKQCEEYVCVCVCFVLLSLVHTVTGRSLSSCLYFFSANNAAPHLFHFLNENFLCFFFLFIFFVDICVPISESVLSPHISPLDEHNKLYNKDNWKKTVKPQAKHSLKGRSWMTLFDMMLKTYSAEEGKKKQPTTTSVISEHCHCCPPPPHPPHLPRSHPHPTGFRWLTVLVVNCLQVRQSRADASPLTMFIITPLLIYQCLWVGGTVRKKPQCPCCSCTYVKQR